MRKSANQITMYKEIMGGYPTGVTIITSTNEMNEPIGMTVNSFTSVSLDPLMVLWCIDKGASNFNGFKTSNKFAVNILAGNQKDLCWLFANKNEKNRFAKANWQFSENGLPILDDVYAVLECQKVQEIESGDHVILVGEVVDLRKNDVKPMLYYRRTVGFLPRDWESENTSS